MNQVPTTLTDDATDVTGAGSPEPGSFTGSKLLKSNITHQASTILTGTGYRGIANRPDMKGNTASMEIAMRPGKRKMLAKDSAAERIEQIKARLRSKVEHPFRIFKCVFGYTKVRYRGLAKNKARLNVMAGLANLITMKRHLLA